MGVARQSPSLTSEIVLFQMYVLGRYHAIDKRIELVKVINSLHAG